MLSGLSSTERTLVTGQRAGWTVPEFALLVSLADDETGTLLQEANWKVRRSSRRLAAEPSDR